jgi:hypothetical protein
MTMSKMSIVCEEFRMAGNGGKLVGFAKIKISEMRMTIHNVPIFKGDRGYSAGMPSVPMFKNGEPMKGEDGKTKYQRVVEFADKETSKAFSARVIEAVRASDPMAFS